MKNTAILLLSYVLIFSSCAPRRDLVYFSNLAKLTSEQKIEAQEVKIQQNDLLKIKLNSLSAESNALFTDSGYRVNKEGKIHTPLTGDIKLEGLTIEEAQRFITASLGTSVKSSAVEIQLINFKVTVIGEVSKPSSFVVQGNNINLLEALGMAGDMTVYGKRENVLVIREQNGQRTLKRLNLNDENVLKSPFFYLKQNDIVYVEPDKSKATEYSANTRLMPIVIASISAVAVLITAVLRK